VLSRLASADIRETLGAKRSLGHELTSPPSKFCGEFNLRSHHELRADFRLVPACINWRIGPLANARGSERNSGP
jgi:hypothetical protein